MNLLLNLSSLKLNLFVIGSFIAINLYMYKGFLIPSIMFVFLLFFTNVFALLNLKKFSELINILRNKELFLRN